MKLRQVLSLMALLFALTATASETKFYYYYNAYKTFPTGAGLIYAAKEAADPRDENLEWADEMEVKYVYESLTNQADFYVIAKPADGWLFYGLSTAVDNGEGWVPATDESGNIVLSNTSYPARFTPESSYSADTRKDCEKLAPSKPEACAYAIFSHVIPRVGTGQTSLGSVGSSKTVNNVGDEVTLTATPANETVTFLHWKKASTGELITDNPLTLTVEGAEEYTAYFESPLSHYYNLPEGGYIQWYNDNYSILDCNGTVGYVNTTDEALNLTEDDKFYLMDPDNGTPKLYPETPVLLWLKGEVTIIEYPSYNAWFTPKPSCARWTGEEPVAVSTLTPDECYYYTVDTAHRRFTIVSDVENTVLLAGTLYLEFLKDNFDEEEPYQIIYFDMDAAQQSYTGIAQTKPSAPQDGRRFTIGGLQVREAAPGTIVIQNGRKWLGR